MDGTHFAARPLRSFGAMFAEDFDLPASAPEPEVIEPTFSVAELASAREAAWRDGHDAGIEEATATDAAATRHAVEAIAGELHTASDTLAVVVDQSADAIAHLLLDSLAATFPALCARYGDAEARAIVSVVLPGLAEEPSITIRINPRHAASVACEIERLDPAVAARVQITECDAMPPGDVRIAWRNGVAVRDSAALWEQVVAVLAPAGLLGANAAIMETVDGE
jgi:flagellar biosynthesis/type III secretory pathway protein FliH